MLNETDREFWTCPSHDFVSESSYQVNLPDSLQQKRDKKKSRLDFPRNCTKRDLTYDGAN
jgi:hypothetical protein